MAIISTIIVPMIFLWFSYVLMNQSLVWACKFYIPVSIMGVDLSHRPPKHKIDRPHLPCFSYAKPLILVLLRRGCKPQNPEAQNCWASSAIAKPLLFLRQTIRCGSPHGDGSKPQTPEAQNCQTSCAIANPSLFFCKTIHCGCPNGGGSKPQPPETKLPGPICHRKTIVPQTSLACGGLT